VAVLVRAVYVVAVLRNRGLGLDGDSYRLLAQSIRDGQGYSSVSANGTRVATATFPPGYPTYLAVVSYVAGQSVLALRLATAAVGAASVALIGVLGKRIANDTVGLVAAGVAALYLPLITTDGSFMAEPLYLVGVLVVVHAALSAKRRPSAGWALLIGAAIGVTALVRTEALLLIPCIALPALLLARPAPRLLAGAAALVVLVPVAFLLPWHIRNASTFDQPVWFSGNGATAVAGTACDRHFSGSETGLWTFGCLALPGSPRFPDESGLYAALRTHASEYTRGHLSAMPRVVAIREVRTWGLWAPIQQARFEAPEGRSPGWQVAAWFEYVVVLALGVGGVVIATRERFERWPLFGLLVIPVIASVVTYGNQRFRIAAEPAIVVFAAIALWKIGQRFLDRRASTRRRSPSLHDGRVIVSGFGEVQPRRRPD
jgi:4-amino-4-deoxy-L-arabinose transferase-like glycosyltransferase